MTDDLPEGWACPRLAEITTAIQYGFTASADHGGQGPRLLRITDIQDGRVEWANVPGCKIGRADLDKYRLEPNDIVFARSGATTGKSFLIRETPLDAVFASYLIRVRANEQIVDATYLSHFFQSPDYWGFIKDNVAGNAQPNCNGSKLAALPVVLPLPEQRRIVAKVDALLARIAAARERLEKAPLLLKRLRQAVLAKAFRGELVPTEVELVAREGRQSRAAAQLLSGKVVELGDDLPEGWVYARAGDLFSYVTSGSRNWSQYYADSGALFIRITNLDHGSITLDLADRKYVKLPDEAEGKRTRVQTSDILFSITADVGMVALVPPKVEEAYVNQHIALARPVPQVCPEYLAWYFAAESGGQVQLRELQRGATKVGLALEDISSVTVPLPPLAEQRRIVAKVEAVLAQADALELSIDRSRDALARTPQTILQRAFAGELVPTEAELAQAEGREFESAEELLRRVSAESATVALATKAAGRRGSPRKGAAA